MNLNYEVLDHPPYSPDIAPSDYHLFRSMNDGLIDFGELTKILTVCMEQKILDEDLSKCFNIFDYNKDGSVCHMDIYKTLKKFNEKCTSLNDCKLIVYNLAKNNASFTFEEFKDLSKN
ncbi:hypothetical protein A3Q56_07483 [Intoshia linei]|uniref:EF-hand domain-containing protein n=1 Tax=Intoshia linei TaxID=1819745 RepID=A0A177AS48_9BILA|nr:hypothetical protein A3Q56_07483 [Intoshia linei]